MTEPPDDRVSWIRAYQRASEATGIVIVMLLPGLAGRLIDRQLGTWIVFTAVGFAAGFAYGVWRLMKLADKKENDRGRSDSGGASHF